MFIVKIEFFRSRLLVYLFLLREVGIREGEGFFG